MKFLVWFQSLRIVISICCVAGRVSPSSRKCRSFSAVQSVKTWTPPAVSATSRCCEHCSGVLWPKWLPSGVDCRRTCWSAAACCLPARNSWSASPALSCSTPGSFASTKRRPTSIWKRIGSSSRRYARPSAPAPSWRSPTAWRRRWTRIAFWSWTLVKSSLWTLRPSY